MNIENYTDKRQKLIKERVNELLKDKCSFLKVDNFKDAIQGIDSKTAENLLDFVKEFHEQNRLFSLEALGLGVYIAAKSYWNDVATGIAEQEIPCVRELLENDIFEAWERRQDR